MDNILRDAIECAIITTDLDFNITYYNSRTEQFFGSTVEEFFDKTIMEIHSMEGVPREHFKKGIENVRTYGEHRYQVVQQVNDKNRYLDKRVTGIHDSDGELVGFALFIRDITKWVQSQKALKNSTQQYKSMYAMFRLMADNMPDMLWAKDLDNHYLFTNQAICDKLLLAGDTAEPIGKDDMFYANQARQTHPDDPEWHTFGEICTDSDAIVADSGQPQKFNEFGNVQGKFLFLEVYKAPIWNEKGKMIGTVGCGRDVTREKQIEKELQESKQRYELATSAGHVGVWDWDFKTNEIYIDSSLKALMGYKDHEIGTKQNDWSKLLHPDDVMLVKSKANNYLEGLTPSFEVTHRMIHKNGQTHWILARGTAMCDAEGNPYRVVGTATDISERKQAEDRLKSRTRELALLNSAGQTFVSSLKLDQVLISVLDEVHQIIGITACSIWLVDPESGDLVCKEAVFHGNDTIRDLILTQSKTITEWVVRHGDSLNIPDLQKDKHHFKKVVQQSKLHLRSILCVPLRTKNETFGALKMADERENRFDTDDMHLAESLATLASIAIENARLYQQTQQDAETKSLLLKEVNHRVKNNLATLSGMLYIEQRHASESRSQCSHAEIMEDLINRMKGLQTVHQLLSNSNWAPLSLKKLSWQVIDSALQALPSDRQIMIDVSSSVPTMVTPKDAHNLAIIINELTINVIKYATSGRKITRLIVRIDQQPDEKTIFITFQDDGPGYPAPVLRLEDFHVGLYLVENTVRHSLRGELKLHNDNGAVVTMQFVKEIE